MKNESSKREFTDAFLGLLSTMCIVWFVIYIVFRNVFNSFLHINTVEGVLMFVIIWSSGLSHLWNQEQRVKCDYKKLVIISILWSVLSPVLSIILILISKDKVTARIIGVAVSTLLCYGWVFLSHMKDWRNFYSMNIWKYALQLSIPLIPHYLSGMILNSADRIMIQRMVGESQSGIYSLAYSVSLIMTVFNSSLLSTIEPWLYKKIKNNRVEDIHMVAYPCLATIAIVNIFLIILAPEVIRLFAPAEYYEAIWIIPPVAMSVFFMFTYSLFATFEFYFEHTSYITIATGTGAVINLLLNYVFIKQFGYMAAGYTTLVCYMVYSGMHYYFMKKICKNELEGKHPYNTKIIILIAGLFMIMSFLLMMTYKHTIIRYGLLLSFLVSAIICRDKIIKMFKFLIQARNQSKKSND